MHWPGIEPGPPSWQARILPLYHQGLGEKFAVDLATVPKVTTSSEVFFICCFLFSISVKSNCHFFLSLNGDKHS